MENKSYNIEEIKKLALYYKDEYFRIRKEIDPPKDIDFKFLKINSDEIEEILIKTYRSILCFCSIENRGYSKSKITREKYIEDINFIFAIADKLKINLNKEDI